MKRLAHNVVVSIALMLMMGACTTINIDHVQLAEQIDVRSGDDVVILGRHHSAEFETEPSLVACVGRRVQSDSLVNVIPEQRFVDMFYPYFEARTAPLHPKRLEEIFKVPVVAQKLQSMDLRYLIWIEGSTERTGSGGTMSCTITGAGGGCFGFGTWADTSDYEAIIWDATTYKEVARVSTDAVGTSYMPAFVIPVPLVAQVQSNACQGMGTQLAKFLSGESSAMKVVEK